MGRVGQCAEGLSLHVLGPHGPLCSSFRVSLAHERGANKALTSQQWVPKASWETTVMPAAVPMPCKLRCLQCLGRQEHAQEPSVGGGFKGSILTHVCVELFTINDFKKMERAMESSK